MKRPILFKGEMVKAILEGRKTQTRRVVKLASNGGLVLERNRHYNVVCDLVDGIGAMWRPYGGADLEPLPREQLENACPYGKPGDLLGLKETWRTLKKYDNLKPSQLGYGVQIQYRSDEPTEIPEDYMGRWRSPPFMPAWVTRIWLEIKSVRVERVQKISEEDAIAEGAEPFDFGDTGSYHESWKRSHEYRDGFEELWDSINGKRGFGWDSNPWVWVVEFERVDHE